MANMEQKDWWVVEMESSIEGETRQEDSHDGVIHDGVIHKVPESLLREGATMFYLPQFISLGPYHFIGKDKPGDEMELLKTEVARSVHLKLQDGAQRRNQKDSPQRRNQSEIKQKNKKVDEIVEVKKEKESYVKVDESGLKWAIESFKKKEKEIKESYAREFEVTGEVCAWMMARDACFVLHVLERFREDEDERSVESVSASIDRTLSRKRYHLMMTEIVTDMLKMENQLPFWALKEIRPDIEKWFESALKNLSPIKVAYVGDSRRYKKTSHILQLLHDYIVDSEQSPASSFSSSFYSHSIAYFILMTVCRPNCHHPPRRCILLWNWIKRLFSLLVYLGYYFILTIMVILLSPVLLVMFIIFLSQDLASLQWERGEHVPTVEELKRLGVKFKKLKGHKRGISHIEFKSSTLYLPQFKVDNKSEVILRNLIALEICSKEEEKPITRYAIMMNDLINTSEDVAILRGEDVIISKLGNDEDIAKLWNSMVPSTEMPGYKPIDKAVSGINGYRKKWWKVQWAQFVMIHCSKPWLVVSLLAGFILLLLTIVQVVCLFESCQIK